MTSGEKPFKGPASAPTATERPPITHPLPSPVWVPRSRQLLAKDSDLSTASPRCPCQTRAVPWPSLWGAPRLPSVRLRDTHPGVRRGAASPPLDCWHATPGPAPAWAPRHADGGVTLEAASQQLGGIRCVPSKCMLHSGSHMPQHQQDLKGGSPPNTLTLTVRPLEAPAPTPHVARPLASVRSRLPASLLAPPPPSSSSASSVGRAEAGALVGGTEPEWAPSVPGWGEAERGRSPVTPS